MSERLLYKYNNKVELVNTHMTKRKSDYDAVEITFIPMYKINITINENKETNLPSGILWGNQTKTCILKAVRRLTTRFHEISK